MSEHFDLTLGSSPGFPLGALPSKISPLQTADQPWLAHVRADSAKAPSAVLALFIRGQNQASTASFVLTRRSTTVRSHKGQISLAGGRRDPGDSSPAATAVREGHEELGLNPDLVKVHGMLAPVTGMDGAPIFPVVASANIEVHQLEPAAAEVSEIIAVPWPMVAAQAAKSFEFNLFGYWRSSWMFETPRGNIWGLTALILHRAELA